MEKYEKPSMEIMEIESDIITASCKTYSSCKYELPFVPVK